MRQLTGLFITLSLALGADLSVANPGQLVIEEWEVSWQGRPRDPFVDQLGRTWFCGQAGNYIAYLEPESGKFKRFELSAGVHPHNLIVDADNQVWYAGNTDAHIGKLNPDTGDISKFAMDAPELKDPHTLVFNQKGNIWFTAQWGNGVGLLNTKTGKIRYTQADTPSARPYGIKMSTKNQPWVVLLGTNQLLTVDPNRFKTTTVTLPRSEARPRRLEVDQQDNIWYVDYAEGYLGRYSPRTKAFKEWPMPGGNNSRPYGTALDKNQILWIAETGVSPNRLVGFDTGKEVFLQGTEIPSGGSIRHMFYHEAKHEIWFGVDTGFISRARIID